MPNEDAAAAAQKGLGVRLRAERERQQIGLRELARRLSVSPSLISQIETGKSTPSVATLYAIVTELGVSLDQLLFDGAGPGESGRARGAQALAVPVQRAKDRDAITLDSGVCWERLTPNQDPVDFLAVTYPPGAESAPVDALMRHSGREYGIVLEGKLGVQIGFDSYTLVPGDSVCFDSTMPHRLWAIGDKPAKAIWMVIGRSGDSRLSE